jgi:hypothetical protein
LEDSILKTHQLLVVAVFTSLNRLSNFVSLPTRDCDNGDGVDNCAATMTKIQNCSSGPFIANLSSDHHHSWRDEVSAGLCQQCIVMQWHPQPVLSTPPCILCLVAVETRASYQSVTSVRDTVSHFPVESWHDFVISR